MCAYVRACIQTTVGSVYQNSSEQLECQGQMGECEYTDVCESAGDGLLSSAVCVYTGVHTDIVILNSLPLPLLPLFR